MAGDIATARPRGQGSEAPEPNEWAGPGNQQTQRRQTEGEADEGSSNTREAGSCGATRHKTTPERDERANRPTGATAAADKAAAGPAPRRRPGASGVRSPQEATPPETQDGREGSTGQRERRGCKAKGGDKERGRGRSGQGAGDRMRAPGTKLKGVCVAWGRGRRGRRNGEGNSARREGSSGQDANGRRARAADA
ncbi:hypothetical protein WJX82_005233 [Trebouxia sp. C0006]